MRCYLFFRHSYLGQHYRITELYIPTDLFALYETKNVDDCDKTPLNRLSGFESDIQT